MQSKGSANSLFFPSNNDNSNGFYGSFKIDWNCAEGSVKSLVMTLQSSLFLSFEFFSVGVRRFEDFTFIIGSHHNLSPSKSNAMKNSFCGLIILISVRGAFHFFLRAVFLRVNSVFFQGTAFIILICLDLFDFV